MTTHTNTRIHVQVGFANPHLICDECKKPVRYWHDPDRCGCDSGSYNYPCEHKLGVTSVCPTWGPVFGCICRDKSNHGKV